MPIAKKRGASWRCQVYANGERKSFTADTKKEAEFLASEWQLHANEHKKSGMTVEEALERYITDKSAVLSPKTIKERKVDAKRISGEIKSMYINDINVPIIQSWVSSLSMTLAPKTVHNTFGTLSSAVSFYSDTTIKVKLPQKKKQEIYIPSNEEVAHLLDITKDDTEMYTATLLASNAGLRRGEICALENNKADFRKGKIDIHQAFVDDSENRIILKNPKSYEGNRIIKPPKTVTDHLLSLPANQKYVVTIHPHNITQRFGSTIEREFDNYFSFHDLRHYYASVLIALNVPERYIMYLMGHSSPDMVRKVYGHIMHDKTDEITDKINTFFAEKNS